MKRENSRHQWLREVAKRAKEQEGDPSGPRAARTERRWGWAMVLVAYTTMLCLSGMAGPWLAFLRPSLWLSESLDPASWVVHVSLSALFQLALFVLLGGLVFLWLRRSDDDTSRLAVGGMCALLATAVTIARFDWPPALLIVFIAFMASAVGAWGAAHLARGVGATMAFVAKAGLLLVVLAAGAAGAVYGLGQDDPLGLVAVEVTPAQKKELVRKIRNGEPEENGAKKLELTDDDVRQMLASGFDQVPVVNGKADVRFSDGAVQLDVSVETPLPKPFGRYLNSEGEYRVAMSDGQLQLRPERLRIGSVEVPRLAARLLASAAVAVLRADRDASEVLASIRRLQLQDQKVEVAYQTDRLKDVLKTVLRDAVGVDPDITAKYVAHVLNAAGEFPKEGDQQFLAFTKTAFELAAKRAESGDPVMENKSAIMALAIVLGHSRLGTISRVPLDPSQREAIPQYMNKVPLRGRLDWTRHFWVSAALEVLGSTMFSDAVGVLKEEMDSAGGSGFSFPDLAADMAGTRFSVAATRDAAAARRMQQRVIEGLKVEDVFPEAGDLPEGMQEAEFKQKYGDKEDDRYKQEVAKITQRLKECAALELGE